MMKLKRLNFMLLGLTDTVKRFTATTILLIGAVSINGLMIGSNYDNNYGDLFMTFLMGAAIVTVLQLVYERFGSKILHRWLLMVIGLAITFLYYLFIKNTRLAEQEVSIRTFVYLFLLAISFLWVPVIKSKFDFNDSFMAFFKALMTALFYSLILFLGIALIIGATDLLIMDVKGTAYVHTANIVFLLYAPLHFLTLIPIYQEHKVDTQVSSGKNAAVEAPKFLENLISYVIIPITAVFTIILLIYILTNITGDFWSDNLLEQMLVTYSITVITVYLLGSKLENAFARNFRRIFPKVLVPIVLFQTLSSILKIGDLGITYERYYVILFGVFAAISGIIFSVLPVKKNGLIAPVLIVLALLSIIWPVDAFTVSRTNQADRLKTVLLENDMLSDNTILPNANLSQRDRTVLVSALEYLERFDYVDRYSWLSTYESTSNFTNTFGFSKYPIDDKYQDWYLHLSSEEMVAISGYDYLKQVSIYGREERDLISFEKNGSTYSLGIMDDGEGYLVLKSGELVLAQLSSQEIRDRFEKTDQYSREMTIEEATFTVENNGAILTLVAQSINISNRQEQVELQIEGYLLVRIP